MKLNRDYYFVDGKPLGERNPKWLRNDYVAIGSVAAIATVLVFTRSFGHMEMRLLARKTQSFASTFIPHPSRKAGESLPTSSHLQGHRDWEPPWNELREFAVRLDLQLPDRGELQSMLQSVLQSLGPRTSPHRPRREPA